MNAPQLQLLQAADHYAALGLVVVSMVAENGQKKPHKRAWQRLTVAKGWRSTRYQLENGYVDSIGIVAGRNSGNLFQIEIDGMAFYDEVVAAIPELKDT